MDFLHILPQRLIYLITPSFGKMLNKHLSSAQCLLVSYINMTKMSCGLELVCIRIPLPQFPKS